MRKKYEQVQMSKENCVKAKVNKNEWITVLNITETRNIATCLVFKNLFKIPG